MTASCCCSVAKLCLTLCNPLQVVVVQSPSYVWLFPTPWTAACQAPCPSPSPRICPSSCPLIELVLSSKHLMLCHLLSFCLHSSPTSVFSNELAVRIRWLKYWSFSFSISPPKEYSGLICFMIDWFDLLDFQGILQESSLAPSSKASILPMICLLNKSMPVKLLKYQIYGSYLYLKQ